MANTPRWAVPYPAAADPPNGPAQMQAIAEKVDQAAIYGQGLLADRPTSSGGSPGIQGRVYWATDVQTLYWDFGTGWTAIGPSVIADGVITEPKYATDSVSQRALANDSVGAAEIIADSVGASELAPGAVTGTEVNSTLKPSGGAGSSTESLRALGTSAGQALPGTTRLPFHVSGLTEVGTGAATTETDLITVTIPAGKFAIGDQIDLFAHFTVAGAAGTRILRLYFGGSVVIADVIAVTGERRINATAIITAGNQEKWSVLSQGLSENELVLITTSIGAAGAGSIQVKITGQTANAADEITGKMLIAGGRPA